MEAVVSVRPWAGSMTAGADARVEQLATRRPMSTGESGCGSWRWRRSIWPRWATSSICWSSQADPPGCKGPLHPPHAPRHARMPSLPHPAHQRRVLPRAHTGQEAPDQPRPARGPREQGEWADDDPAPARRWNQRGAEEAVYQDWAAGCVRAMRSSWWRKLMNEWDRLQGH